MNPTPSANTRIEDELSQQNAAWEEAMETIRSLEPNVAIAVNPGLLEAIDDACRGEIQPARSAPAGAIRA